MPKISVLNGKILTKDGSLIKFLQKYFNIGSGFNWMVLTIAIDKNDKIYLGGNFTNYNGQTANRIIRLNPDGTKDTDFDNSVGFGNGEVRAIYIDEDTDKIYVGGNFTSYKGQTENYIIRLNPDGTKDTGFDNSTGFNNTVNCIIKNPQTTEIFVGGNFTTYKGQTNNCIIKLAADGSKVENFDNSIGFGGTGPSVTTILFVENKLYVGGTFTLYKSVSNNRIIRLNLDGSKDTAFVNGTGFDNSVQTIIVAPNNHIYAAGTFGSYKGVSTNTNKLVRLNNIGTRDVTFAAGSFSQTIFGLLSTVENSEHKLYVVGAFAPGFISKLNFNGSRDTQVIDNYNGFNFETWAIAQDSRKRILIGGLFTTYKYESYNRIIRLNLDGSINTKTS
jgi:uncharacterized delta-60 repeat protein